MIQVEKLSYGFPEKELYRNISFSIEQGQHCALIGSNGCGKSTLVEMLTNPEKYWFDGKITKDEEPAMPDSSACAKKCRTARCLNI